MANKEIRETAKRKGVCHWRIAQELGVHETTFTRKLRNELPQEEKSNILAIIDKLSKEEC